MRSRLAALPVLLTCVGALLAPGAAADDTTGPRAVSNAVLRWGINNESNNAAHAPGTYNFLSAGVVPNPGKGGSKLPKSSWKQVDGAVSIEKFLGGAWGPATWEGLSTDSAGQPLGSPTSGRYSNHEVVLGGGVGSVDAAAGTASVTWAGSFTVVFYSGMSFFTVADPALEVAAGTARVTATLGGYASSLEDPTKWEPVPPVRVVLADLPAFDLASTSITVTPAYPGSFPQSFVAFQEQLGTAAFWRASGGSTDAAKVPLPISLHLPSPADPAAPTPTTAPSAAAPAVTGAPTKAPTVTNSAPAPPKQTKSPTPTRTSTGTSSPTPTAAPTAAVPVAAPVSTVGLPSAPPPVAVAFSGPAPAPVVLVAAQVESADSSAVPTQGSDRLWWLGGALLLAAALTSLVPVRPRPQHQTR